MYANRYPITLRLALREIWIVSSRILGEYRADARMRAARRRDARLRERLYRHPGQELDRSLWFVAIVIIFALVGLTMFEGWSAVDHWLFGAAGAAKAITAAVAVHHGRLKPETMGMLRYLVRHPGSLQKDLEAQFPDIGGETIRRRLMYLREAGYVDRKPAAKLAGQDGGIAYTWSVVHWPDASAQPVHEVAAAAAPAPAAEPEAPRPVVPPRRPDNAQPWTTPYLSSAGRRPGADDFRRAPTLHSGQRHAYQPKP